MLLMKHNTNEAIVGYLTGRAGRGMRFYCPKTSKVFEASPCETCGTMTAHANEITIEFVDEALHRALSEYYSVLDFVEFVGYDEDTGEDICEECNGL